MLGRLEPSDPRRIGAWRTVGRLGAGGMGVVYLAERDGKRAAVKVIHAALAADPDFLSRFRREVHAGEAVTGHHVAAVLDSDPEGRPPWLATEYIPGPTLAGLVASDGALPAVQTVALAAGLLEGMARIHAAGIVHRDLKPSNILLTESGPVIIDFGIASIADVTSLTTTGMTVGSAGWMAPEQVRGAEAGPAADVFSWGACVAFAGTGRLPFGVGRADALAYRVAHEPPDLTGLPRALQPAVVGALAKDPNERPTVAELQDHISGDGAAGATRLAARWEAPTTVSTQIERLDSRGLELRRARRWHAIVLVAPVLAVIAVAAGGYAVLSADDGESAGAPTTTVPTTAPPPTTASPTTHDVQTTTTVAPTTTPTPALAADLLGDTDTEIDHWRPSDVEPSQSFMVRVFDVTWQHVAGFPVTMNGCGSRQLRVAWRSINQPVQAGVSYFQDFDETPIVPDQVSEPAQAGTMILNGCEQPAFSASPGDSISDIAVDVSVHYPAAGL